MQNDPDGKLRVEFYGDPLFSDKEQLKEGMRSINNSQEFMSTPRSAQSDLSQLGDINVHRQDGIFAAVPLFKTLSLALIFFFKMIIFQKFFSEIGP